MWAALLSPFELSAALNLKVRNRDRSWEIVSDAANLEKGMRVSRIPGSCEGLWRQDSCLYSSSSFLESFCIWLIPTAYFSVPHCVLGHMVFQEKCALVQGTNASEMEKSEMGPPGPHLQVAGGWYLML